MGWLRGLIIGAPLITLCACVPSDPTGGLYGRMRGHLWPPKYGPPAPPPRPPMPDAPGKVLTSAIMIGKPQPKLAEPKSIIKPERVKMRPVLVQQRMPSAAECARMASGIAMVGREGVKVAARARFGFSDAVVTRALRDCGL